MTIDIRCGISWYAYWMILRELRSCSCRLLWVFFRTVHRFPHFLIKKNSQKKKTTFVNIQKLCCALHEGNIDFVAYVFFFFYFFDDRGRETQFWYNLFFIFVERHTVFGCSLINFKIKINFRKMRSTCWIGFLCMLDMLSKVFTMEPKF